MRIAGIIYGVLAILVGIAAILMPPITEWEAGNAVFGIFFILFGIFFVVQAAKRRKK